MDIKKAINELKGFTDGTKYDTEYTDLEAFDLAISTLEKQLNSGWIPIDKEEPKTGTECLVTNESKEICHVYYAGDKKYHFVSYYDRTMQSKVIAWMPLPEPYKEVENE